MTDASMPDTRRRKLGDISQSDSDAVVATRTTRSDTRKVVAEKTEALLSTVLRTCGSLFNERRHVGV